MGDIETNKEPDRHPYLQLTTFSRIRTRGLLNYIGIPGASFLSLKIRTPFQVSGARTNCPIVTFVQFLLVLAMFMSKTLVVFVLIGWAVLCRWFAVLCRWFHEVGNICFLSLSLSLSPTRLSLSLSIHLRLYTPSMNICRPQRVGC